jgi:hypothetical protein
MRERRWVIVEVRLEIGDCPLLLILFLGLGDTARGGADIETSNSRGTSMMRWDGIGYDAVRREGISEKSSGWRDAIDELLSFSTVP